MATARKAKKQKQDDDDDDDEEEPADDEEPLSVISTNMLKWPCQFGPRFDPILNQRFFSPLKMSHYHLLTRINLTSARHKWPIINRLLPMGFGFEICVIAIRILNDPNNVQQVSEWIVKNQEKELKSLQEYRRTVRVHDEEGWAVVNATTHFTTVFCFWFLFLFLVLVLVLLPLLLPLLLPFPSGGFGHFGRQRRDGVKAIYFA